MTVRTITIYKITNLINGKIYIGKTVSSARNRFLNHLSRSRCGDRRPLYRSIRKHGEDMFRLETLISGLDCSLGDKEEIRLIEALRPQYNITLGGGGLRGYVPTEETRKKLALAAKGRAGYWRGKTRDQEFKDKARLRGKRPEQMAVIRKAIEAAIASRLKKVVCINDGAIFDSVSSAAKKYFLSTGAISNVCKKKKGHHTARGLVFRYFGEHLITLEDASNEAASFRISRKSRIGISRRVVCLTDGKIYESVSAAARAYGANRTPIASICNGAGPYKTTRGLRFSWHESAAQ